MIIKLSEEEFIHLSRNYEGFCYACGEMDGPVEPDARDYECPACGENQVHGLEEALMEGRVDII